MYKRIFAFLIPTLVLSMFSIEVYCFEPYQNYTYDFEQTAWKEPQAYIPAGIISGESLGITRLKNPSDIFIASNKNIYIVDTGNNRIIVMDENYKFIKVIDSFSNQDGSVDAFNKPEGIYVTNANKLYIADTENKRIVILDDHDNLVSIVREPKFNVETSLVFMPIKISIDNAGRMFVISRNFNMGMIELDKEGNFSSFYGAITVTSSIIGRLWRRIATQQQRDKMIQSVPTEYSGSDVDSEGFIYGTISTLNSYQPIRKLNPMGVDVLRRMGLNQPQGDLSIAFNDEGWQIKSSMVDICVDDYGIYSVLDATRGRIFTYNNDGVLLYVFGAIGNRAGCFILPKALDKTSDGEFLVLDGILNQIIRFKPTEYANMINDAVDFQFNRKYSEAENKWIEVLRYTSKSELAYVEIGKSFYRNSNYESAMKYFKLGNDRAWFSKAFKKYRENLLNKYFDSLMTTLIITIILVLVLVFYKIRRKEGNH